MKASVLAVAAAIATGANAGQHRARHAHEDFHYPRGMVMSSPLPNATCGCTTIYTTITGEGTLLVSPLETSAISAPETVATSAPETTAISAPETVATSAPETTATSAPETSTVVVVPTAFPTTCPTTGIYTFPSTTITVPETTTVCEATSTKIPSGTHTVGGVTTVVSSATTIVCPYAITSSNSGTVTSVISTTTHVCPSAGTYTIAPLTTTCSEETVWVYPTPQSFTPGTYTRSEATVTVTETDYVYICPFSSPAPVPAPTTSTKAGPPVSTSSPYVAIPPVSVSVALPPVSTSTKSPQTSESAKPQPSSGSSPNTSGVGVEGEVWAVSYTPYSPNGQCRSASDVEADIATIKGKGFSSIRLYSTDCQGLENVGNACKQHGLKMIVGVFIDSSCEAAQPQVEAIAKWALWDIVELVVIGNEALFNGHASAGELAAFIKSSKQTLSAAGYTGPCTTTEPLDIWQENKGALCDAVDIVGCNVHPFFNSGTSAAQAGDFLSTQLEIMDNLCSGKKSVNLECGWPTEGSCNGDACPGTEQQQTAIAGIKKAGGGKTVILSFANDMWKQPGEFGCEQFWGAMGSY